MPFRAPTMLLFMRPKQLLRKPERTHIRTRGVHTTFSRIHVRDGTVPTEVGKLLSRPFERRREADYDDGAMITKAQSHEALDLARQFVEHIQKLLDG